MCIHNPIKVNRKDRKNYKIAYKVTNNDLFPIYYVHKRKGKPFNCKGKWNIVKNVRKYTIDSIGFHLFLKREDASLFVKHLYGKIYKCEIRGIRFIGTTKIGTTENRNNTVIATQFRVIK